VISFFAMVQLACVVVLLKHLRMAFSVPLADVLSTWNPRTHSLFPGSRGWHQRVAGYKAVYKRATQASLAQASLACVPKSVDYGTGLSSPSGHAKRCVFSAAEGSRNQGFWHNRKGLLQASLKPTPYRARFFAAALTGYDVWHVQSPLGNS
jgi:hypothetical protein